MKAAVQTGYGPIEEAIVVRDEPTPVPGPGDVVVRVVGSTLNRKELFALSNLAGPGIRKRRPLPHINGADGWGEVAELGPGVEGWAPGDRVAIYPGLYCGSCEWCVRGEQSACVWYGVLGEQVPGAHAEYVRVAARNLERLPDGVAWEDLPASCASWATAWRALVTAAQVQAGETVVIVGASGGVGTGALRIAQLAGCRTIAVVGSEAKAKRALEVGADAAVDYSREDFERRTIALTGGRGADVVLDSVGAPTWRRSINALRPFGRLVICGATAGDQPEISIREIYQQHRRIIGAPLGSRGEFCDVVAAVAAGRLKPIVQATFPLSAMHEALRALESREVFGKIVITA